MRWLNELAANSTKSKIWIAMRVCWIWTKDTSFQRHITLLKTTADFHQHHNQKHKMVEVSADSKSWLKEQRRRIGQKHDLCKYAKGQHSAWLNKDYLKWALNVYLVITNIHMLLTSRGIITLTHSPRLFLSLLLLHDSSSFGRENEEAV